MVEKFTYFTTKRISGSKVVSHNLCGVGSIYININSDIAYFIVAILTSFIPSRNES